MATSGASESCVDQQAKRIEVATHAYAIACDSRSRMMEEHRLDDDQLDVIVGATTAVEDARAVLDSIVATAPAPGTADDNHAKDVAVATSAVPSPAETPLAPSPAESVASARAVIRAENVDLFDAELAFDHALAMTNRAHHAKIVTYAAIAAAREPVEPERVYTLRTTGGSKSMRDPLTIDIAATSEGRAWVEMIRASRHLSEIVHAVGNHDILLWRDLKQRIDRDYPGYATVIACSCEDGGSECSYEDRDFA